MGSVTPLIDSARSNQLKYIIVFKNFTSPMIFYYFLKRPIPHSWWILAPILEGVDYRAGGGAKKFGPLPNFQKLFSNVVQTFWANNELFRSSGSTATAFLKKEKKSVHTFDRYCIYLKNWKTAEKILGLSSFFIYSFLLMVPWEGGQPPPLLKFALL